MLKSSVLSLEQTELKLNEAFIDFTKVKADRDQFINEINILKQENQVLAAKIAALIDDGIEA